MIKRFPVLGQFLFGGNQSVVLSSILFSSCQTFAAINSLHRIICTILIFGSYDVFFQVVCTFEKHSRFLSSLHGYAIDCVNNIKVEF